jgi:hypothetical protein
MGSTQIQEATEGQGVRRQRKSRNRRERERDTGKSAEKGVSRTGFDGQEGGCGSDTGNFGEKSVSRTGFDRKEVECCSDTGKSAEKGVSRSEANLTCGAKLPDTQLIMVLWVGKISHRWMHK